MKLRILLTLVCAFLLFYAVEPALAETPIATPSGKIVTLADDGQTITLQVNERFLLKLGEGYDWEITIDNQSVVSRFPNVAVVIGAQGLYEAHKLGSAKLTAFGDPICRKSQPPCEAPTRVFRLNIEVVGKQSAAPAFETLLATFAILIAMLISKR